MQQSEQLKETLYTAPGTRSGIILVWSLFSLMVMVQLFGWEMLIFVVVVVSVTVQLLAEGEQKRRNVEIRVTISV